MYDSDDSDDKQNLQVYFRFLYQYISEFTDDTSSVTIDDTADYGVITSSRGRGR